MSLREEFRTVIVRHRGGRWWRRWRWAVEEKRYSDGWILKQDGYAFTLGVALRESATEPKPISAKIARVEIATHVEHEKYATSPTRRTPLPPQILEEDQG